MKIINNFNQVTEGKVSDTFANIFSGKKGANNLFGFLTSWLPTEEKEEDPDQKEYEQWAQETMKARQDAIQDRINHKHELEKKYKQLAHQQELNQINAERAREKDKMKRELDALDAAIKQEQLAGKKIQDFISGKGSREGMEMWLKAAASATKDIEPASQQAFKDLQATLATISTDENGEFLKPSEWEENAKKRFGADAWDEIKQNPEWVNSRKKFEEEMKRQDAVDESGNIKPDVMKELIKSASANYKTTKEFELEAEESKKALADLSARAAELSSDKEKAKKLQANIDKYNKLKDDLGDVDGKINEIDENIKVLKSDNKKDASKITSEIYGKGIQDALQNKSEDALTGKDGIFKKTVIEGEDGQKTFKLELNTSAPCIKSLPPEMVNQLKLSINPDPNNPLQYSTDKTAFDDIAKKLEEDTNKILQGEPINPGEDKEKAKKDAEAIQQKIIDSAITSGEKNKEVIQDKSRKLQNLKSEYEDSSAQLTELNKKIDSEDPNPTVTIKVNGVNQTLNLKELQEEHTRREQAVQDSKKIDNDFDHIQSRANDLSQRALKKQQVHDLEKNLSDAEQQELKELTPTQYVKKDKDGKEYIEYKVDGETKTIKEPEKPIAADGGEVSKEDQENYQKELDNYNNLKKLAPVLNPAGKEPEMPNENDENYFEKVKAHKQWEINKQAQKAAMKDLKSDDDLELTSKIEGGDEKETRASLLDLVDKYQDEVDDTDDDKTKDYERIDNNDTELEDDDDDEQDETKPKKDPAKVWKQRTYKRGNKTFKSKNYYNKKGASIDKKEFRKKVEAYNKSKKPEPEPEPEPKPKDESLIITKRNMVFEFYSKPTQTKHSNRSNSFGITPINKQKK